MAQADTVLTQRFPVAVLVATPQNAPKPTDLLAQGLAELLSALKRTAPHTPLAVLANKSLAAVLPMDGLNEVELLSHEPGYEALTENFDVVIFLGDFPPDALPSFDSGQIVLHLSSQGSKLHVKLVQACQKCRLEIQHQTTGDESFALASESGADPDSDCQCANRRIAALDRFNARLSDPATIQAMSNVGYEDDCLTGAPACPTLQKLVIWYRQADLLALSQQRRLYGKSPNPVLALLTDKALVPAIFVTASLAVLALDLSLHFFASTPAFMLWFVAFFLITWCLVVYLHRSKTEQNYADFRSLAEALRVRMFLRAAGTTIASGGDAMKLHRSEYDWLRSVLLGVDLWDHFSTPTGSQDDWQQRRDWVAQSWFQSQHKYFCGAAGKHGAADKMAHRHHSAERWSQLFLFGGAGLALLWAFAGDRILHFAEELHWHHDLIHHGAATLISLLLAAAATVHTYATKRGYASLARRYESMGQIYANATARLHSAPNDEAGKERQLAIMRETAGLALLENGDWIVVQRDNPAGIHLG